MKQIIVLSFAFMGLLGAVSCQSPGNSKEGSHKALSSKVEVYYFHFTRRCSTCSSVETNAQKALEALYAEQVKTGAYVFKAINLDNASGKTIAAKFGVGGQTLLVVCGNNKIDITDKGFMNATDLENMKIEIKKAVEQVIKG